MRAVVQDRYGLIDALELREIEPPAVADDEVLDARPCGVCPS